MRIENYSTRKKDRNLLYGFVLVIALTVCLVTGYYWLTKNTRLNCFKGLHTYTEWQVIQAEKALLRICKKCDKYEFKSMQDERKKF